MNFKDFYKKHFILFWKCVVLSPVLICAILSIVLTGNVEKDINNENNEVLTTSSEAGYIVKKTQESSFHYIISGNDAYPEFREEFYYTMFLDDNYIKFKIPYQVYVEYGLGDHLTIYRKEKYGEYYDYEVVIYDIHIPAIIVNDEEK